MEMTRGHTAKRPLENSSRDWSSEVGSQAKKHQELMQLPAES